MEGLIAINPNDVVASTKKELASAIEQIKQQATNDKMQDDDAPLRFLRNQLQRIDKAGGFDRIVPTEGVVFKHKGKIYKLTGTFAPVNQIIGYIKFGRK
jgi:coproporphyrinogen III oxidase